MSWVMSLIPSAVWRWGAMIGAGLIAVLTILSLRRRLSKARVRAREAERRVKTMRKAKEIGDEVDRMDGDRVRSDLSRWMRPSD